MITAKEINDALDEIMEQAQVFASSYSLIGSKFDKGNFQIEAEEAKSELRMLIKSALITASTQLKP